MRKHKKKKPPEKVAMVLAIIGSILTLINNLLELLQKLLDR